MGPALNGLLIWFLRQPDVVQQSILREGKIALDWYIRHGPTDLRKIPIGSADIASPSERVGRDIAKTPPRAKRA